MKPFKNGETYIYSYLHSSHKNGAQFFLGDPVAELFCQFIVDDKFNYCTVDLLIAINFIFKQYEIVACSQRILGDNTSLTIAGIYESIKPPLLTKKISKSSS